MLPFISSFLIFAFFAVEHKNCAIGEGSRGTKWNNSKRPNHTLGPPCGMYSRTETSKWFLNKCNMCHWTTFSEGSCVTNCSQVLTLRAAPISHRWMLRPADSTKILETRRDQWNKEKSAILAWEGTNPMQRPLQDILLMSSNCLSNAQLLADSVRPSNIQSWSWYHYHPQPSLPTHVNKEKVWKAGSTSSRTYFEQCISA